MCGMFPVLESHGSPRTRHEVTACSENGLRSCRSGVVDCDWVASTCRARFFSRSETVT
jgi:hypothetical protein